MNCHRHHQYHVSQCEQCKDEAYIAYWRSVEALEDFKEVDQGKFLVTIGVILVAIAVVSWLLVG